MSNFKVEQMQESVMNLVGKNIFHCKDTNVLFWCDVLGGQIFKMDLNYHNKIYMFRILGEKVISFCIPIDGKKDQFVVGAGKRLLLVSWDGLHTMGQIIKVLCDIPVNGVRFNGCTVDNQGRLFFDTMISEETGTIFDMNKRVGGLYCYTMHDGLVQLKDKVGIGNGIVFNVNYTKMYFVDSYDLSIYMFDYDFKTGHITNQKVFIDLTNYGQLKKVFPTDLTIDYEDNIYVPMFGAGTILRINSKTHKVDHEIKMNVPQITGCSFGGKNLDTMYVATCGMGLYGQQLYPAGYLMKVTNFGTHGVDMHKFMMN